LQETGSEVRVLDLDLAEVDGGVPDRELERALKEFRPDMAGITSVTPTWPRMIEIARNIKNISPETKVAAGGVHASLFVEETLASGAVDYVAVGEADFTLAELVRSGDPESVPGLACLDGGEVCFSPSRPPVGNLDTLPMPAWDLFEARKYRMSRLTERRRPAGYIETSRGCPFNCIYCNKSTFGRKFRPKSPERVLEEIEILLERYGFRELHFLDDGFTTDLDRAKEICRMIISRGLDFRFNLFNGIRADRLDGEMCRLLKSAGCYQVGFGVESGSDSVLESVSKGLTKDRIRRAVSLCKRHGIETFGFFMIALPEDTRKTVMQTIDFAVELEMTISKFDISIPLPGTKMFENYDQRGLIKTRDWSRYAFHTTGTPVFEHPNLSWDEIRRLYSLAYRKTYLRPGYIARRFMHGLRTGGLWYDVIYFLRSRWN